MRVPRLFVIAALALAATPAGAATTVYYRAGVWHAFSGTDTQDRMVCGIGTENPTDGRTLNLSFVIAGDALAFEAGKPGWNIPDGLSVPVVLQIGVAAPWNFQAIGQGGSLGWSLGLGSIRDFDLQFRQAATMLLSFPSGNEAPWMISLAGSTAADNTFARCITDLTRQMRARPATPTQPFGQAPTQPFTPNQQVNPAPLQPVTPAAPAPGTTGPAPSAPQRPAP